MDRKDAIARRTRLKERLKKEQVRAFTRGDGAEPGLLGNNVAGMRCAILREQIAELDRLIAELPAKGRSRLV